MINFTNESEETAMAKLEQVLPMLAEEGLSQINYEPVPQFNPGATEEEKTDYAFERFQDVKALNKTVCASLLQIGEILCIMRDERLYRYLDFGSFDEFIAQADLGFQRASAYLYMRVFTVFCKRYGVDPKALAASGADFSKLAVVADVVNEENIGEKIAQASALSRADLIKRVREDKKGVALQVVEIYNSKDNFQESASIIAPILESVYRISIIQGYDDAWRLSLRLDDERFRDVFDEMGCITTGTKSTIRAADVIEFLVKRGHIRLARIAQKQTPIVKD